MHFEKSLKRSIYPPWKDQYIDYPKLKLLLHDSGSDAGSASAQDDGTDEWSDRDESAFVEELVNVQLEKVHAFQSSTIDSLRQRTADCEQTFDPLTTAHDHADPHAAASPPRGGITEERRQQLLRHVLAQLDSITKEMNELEKFSRINYTGFMKATKKHDRRRGHSYRVRPLMQVRLAALPFNTEDYSPLLFRLSTMYNFVRQNLDGSPRKGSMSESQPGTEDFQTFKFWVHPENLLELRTMILRRLPVLVFNPQSANAFDGGMRDPTVTSIYFDNPQFSLYNEKVDHKSSASSLRLRWYDDLESSREVFCEKKTVFEDNTTHEQRFAMKRKYIQKFIQGNYSMEKQINKLSDRLGSESDQVKNLEKSVADVRDFIQQEKLEPVLRANYTRTAFQIPGDSRVRITLDSKLALIREDALDQDRPIRHPEDWHRRDIDDLDMEFPFEKVRKGEVNRFPYSILEIRVRGSKEYEWVADLMNSHLVKPAPRFSKFVHGVAQLFDDHVNTFPFWLSQVDQDIRRDPHKAYEQEQQRKTKAAEDQLAVGSFIKNHALHQYGSPGTKASYESSPPLPPSHRSPKLEGKSAAALTKQSSRSKEVPQAEDDVHEDEQVTIKDSRGIRSLLPGIMSKRNKHGTLRLPPGVEQPSFWIKNEGPVKVEAKVWLANQRTFIKWQHVAILLATLSLALFNAAEDLGDGGTARTLGFVYTMIAIFASAWGWGVYMWRSKLIRERSGKEFDSIFGPIVVCVALALALTTNFGFKYRAMKAAQRRPPALRSFDTSRFVRQAADSAEYTLMTR